MADQSTSEFWATAEFDRLLKLGEDDLFAQLGQSLPGAQFGPTDVKNAVIYGRAWFARWRSELAAKVCQSPTAAALLERGQLHNELMERAAIADAVLTFISGPPVVFVTAILVREGLQALCGGCD